MEEAKEAKTEGAGEDKPCSFIGPLKALYYVVIAYTLSVIIATDNMSDRNHITSNSDLLDFFGKPDRMEESKPRLSGAQLPLLFLTTAIAGSIVAIAVMKLMLRTLGSFVISSIAFLLSLLYVFLYLVEKRMLWLYLTYKALNGLILSMFSFSVPPVLHSATPHVSSKVISAEVSATQLINGLILFFCLFLMEDDSLPFKSFIVLSLVATFVTALISYIANVFLGESSNKEFCSYHLYTIMLLKSFYVIVWDYDLLTLLSMYVWLVCISACLKFDSITDYIIFYVKTVLVCMIGALAILVAAFLIL
jgi:hypothetical protein